MTVTSEMTVTTVTNEMANEMIPYEPDYSGFEYNDYAHILTAIGANANDWFTVFQLSGDGTNAEIIIGITGQSERFKVSCPMTSKTFEVLCIDFISSTCVTRDSIDRLNGYRARLGLVSWTLETAYRDYYGDHIHLAPSV
jgi:hypothetical protein